MTPSNHNEQAVVVRDLEKRFGDFIAVDRISFEVGRGEVFGFLGPNGAGKSTTIRMLCGILPPSAGWGTVGGYDIQTQTQAIKSRIGYMSQKFSLYEDLTVEENIDFYGGIYRIPPEKKKQRKEWVLEMADLGKQRSLLTANLPTGWKQRLALGCAILHKPSILFLDEPTSGVDPISRRRFWDLIYDLSGKGITVFVTTHYMDEAEYCDRLGLIYRGELIARGTPQMLKDDFMAGNVMEIICRRPQEALDTLRTMPSVEEVSLFGMSLHVMTKEWEKTRVDIKTYLEETGNPVEKMEKIAPSLEDVFVSLVAEKDRSQAPQLEVTR